MFSAAFYLAGNLNAQAIWYEPGSFQESVILSTGGYYNSERLNFRTSFLLTTAQPATHVTSPIHCPTRNFNWQSYFKADNPETYQQSLVRPSGKILQKAWNQFWFWKHPAAFYMFSDNELSRKSTFLINPVLNLGMGQWAGENTIQNGRGAEIRGNLMQKLAFHTIVVENQARFPAYMNQYRDSLGVVPGLGWWKKFKGNGTDYLQATGYVNAALIGNVNSDKHLLFSAGHGSFAVGQGYRSLILSNFAAPFGFLRFNTRIGAFRYQNLYGSLNGFAPLLGNTSLPKKYLAMHRGSLTFNKFELGFTEMTIHNRPNGGFDVDYLNPIIFYRSVEANLGSADNTLMAFDAAYNHRNFRFYGQFLLDEFKLKYFKQGDWWANKFGWQLGSIYRFSNRQLKGFIQAEYNTVRPYTYSHYDELNSYTHYNQPLAHPLGANFREAVFRFFVIPSHLQKLRISFTGMRAKQGTDPFYNSGLNYGNNPRRDNDTRVSNFDIRMLQGVPTRIVSYRLDVSYMLRHNLHFDIGYQYRNYTGLSPNKGNWLSFGLRLNFDQGRQLF